MQKLKYPDVGSLPSFPVSIQTEKTVGERNSKVNDAFFSWAQEIVDLNGSWIIWQEG
jgi:hypothetical protein